MSSAAAWEGPTAAELKAASAEAIPGGMRVKGWLIQSHKGPILNAASVQSFEDELQTTHLPEMVFGESSLSLQHLQTGIKLHFNALDALKGWKKEALPPVEVPAAAKWKFRSKPSDQVILDYDYTFTTPYCGSDNLVLKPETMQASSHGYGCNTLHWEDTDERIDLVALSAKEPILFYDEVILYEDELADSGISFLTMRVRVMPTGWFLLLSFWELIEKLSEGELPLNEYPSMGEPSSTGKAIPSKSSTNQANTQPSSTTRPGQISQPMPMRS